MYEEVTRNTYLFGSKAYADQIICGEENRKRIFRIKKKYKSLIEE